MKLQECLKSFGWQGVGMKVVSGLSSREIRAMLETCARRWIESEWSCELGTRLKLAVLQLMNHGAWRWPTRESDK